MAPSNDDEEVTSRSESEDEQPSVPRTAQERKKEALYAPIASIVSAMGGFEEFKNDEDEIYTAYSLGDQVIGAS